MADHSDAQHIPEHVGGRLVVVIALELALLLGGTYGAWQVARGQGLGIRARPSARAPDPYSNPIPNGIFGPGPGRGLEAPEERLTVDFKTPSSFNVQVVTGKEEQERVSFRLTSAPTRTTIRVDGNVVPEGDVKRVTQRLRPGFHSIARRRWVHAWNYPGKILVTQDVVLLPNNGSSVLVRYLIENGDTEAHTVGLRFLLPTAVGKTEGVPFGVPGVRELLKEPREFTGKKVPCFLQALGELERWNNGAVATLVVANPDAIAVGEERIAVEPSDRVFVSGMPQADPWDIEPSAFIGEGKASCVAMFWDERRLGPGQARAVGFLYGQGGLSYTDDALEAFSHVAASFAPNPRVGTEFDVMVWVKEPEVGQRATIELPETMRLVEPKKPSQLVLPVGAPVALVSWRVRVARQGGLQPGMPLEPRYEVKVRSGNGTVTLSVPVDEPGFEVVE